MLILRRRPCGSPLMLILRRRPCGSPSLLILRSACTVVLPPIWSTCWLYLLHFTADAHVMSQWLVLEEYGLGIKPPVLGFRALADLFIIIDIVVFCSFSFIAVRLPPAWWTNSNSAKSFDWWLPPHLEQSPPRHQALCYSHFLQKPTQDISLLRVFQLNHIVLHSYQSVQCVCVRVYVCAFYCIIMLENLSMYIYIDIVIYLDNIFHLSVHYVCMLVQRFEPQGRHFTNFHYYYYIVWS